MVRINEIDGEWGLVADTMLSEFVESQHLVFRACTPRARGELKSKEGGQKSVHFNGSDSNTELLLVAHENLDSMVTRTEALVAHSNDQTNVVQGQLFVECE